MATTYYRPVSAGRFGAQVAYINQTAGTVTASATTTHFIGAPHRRAWVEQVAAACTTVPVSASGTILATLYKYDASANSEVTLSSALDLEALTANESAKFSLLSTLTPAQRVMDEGDTLYVKIVSNNAIGTAAVNLHFTAELLVLE